MPNKNSNASHRPQRTCVACKTRKGLEELWSFFILPEGIVFDPERKVQRRKFYVCQQQDCLVGLDKWRRQFAKRNVGLRGTKALFSDLAKEAGEQGQ